MHHSIALALVATLCLPHISKAEVHPGPEPDLQSETIPQPLELRELESRIANALSRLRAIQRDRDFELRVLYEQQSVYANQLYGEVWLQEITAEIQRVSFGYELQMQEANRAFDQLLEELDSLKETGRAP